VPWDAALGVWGLRSEPAATNLLTWSSNLANAAWGGIGTVVPTANAAVAPDGTTTASRILCFAGAWTRRQAIALSAGATYTVSAWVKSAAGTSQLFRLLGSSSLFSADLTATAQWQRFEHTFIATGDQNHGLARSSAEDAADLHVWNVQLETGSRATSPIPTFAATVTRTADSPLVPGLPAMTEGVVVVEFVRTVASGAAEYAHPFSINDGVDYDDEIGAYIEPSTVAGVYLLVRTSGSTVVESAVSGGASGRNALAVGFKADDYAAAVNGGAVTTDTSGALAVRTSLSLGHRLAGDNSLSGGLITRIRLATRKPPNDRVRTLGIVS
jgi:hypothetical protein